MAAKILSTKSEIYLYFGIICGGVVSLMFWTGVVFHYDFFKRKIFQKIGRFPRVAAPC